MIYPVLSLEYIGTQEILLFILALTILAAIIATPILLFKLLRSKRPNSSQIHSDGKNP